MKRLRAVSFACGRAPTQLVEEKERGPPAWRKTGTFHFAEKRNFLLCVDNLEMRFDSAGRLEYDLAEAKGTLDYGAGGKSWYRYVAGSCGGSKKSNSRRV